MARYLECKAVVALMRRLIYRGRKYGHLCDAFNLILIDKKKVSLLYQSYFAWLSEIHLLIREWIQSVILFGVLCVLVNEIL